jgi:hypothetical protein
MGSDGVGFFLGERGGMVAGLKLAVEVAINDGNGPPRSMSQNVIEPGMNGL